MSLPHAVIIAGGQGQRLGGVRKATLRIGGVRLIDRVAASLGAVSEPLMVSTGPERQETELPAGAVAIADLPLACAGPLAGLVAAVAALRRRGITRGVLVSVAVDTPFLPAGFVDAMAAALADAGGAYAAWGDDFYPPNAAWRIEAIAELPELMTRPAPPHSLRALQAALGAWAVDWSASHADNPFLNLNTVADLVALGQLGGASRHSS